MSILLVEHDMDFVMDLTDRIVVMEFGTKLIGGHAGRGAGQPRGARRLPRHRALTRRHAHDPRTVRSVERPARRLRQGRGAASALSLRAAQGSVVTVIGPNGAGKSTLLNALMGVLPAHGRIELRRPSRSGAARRSRSG